MDDERRKPKKNTTVEDRKKRYIEYAIRNEV